MFRDWGHDAHRTAQFKGNTGKAGDVEGPMGLHIEVKFQEHMRLYEWMEQAVRDARASGSNDLPVVIHKQNGKPVLCTMEFESWIQLYNEYVSGMLPFSDADAKKCYR